MQTQPAEFLEANQSSAARLIDFVMPHYGDHLRANPTIEAITEILPVVIPQWLRFEDRLATDAITHLDEFCRLMLAHTEAQQ